MNTIEKEKIATLEIVEHEECSESLLWNTVLLFQYNGYSDNLLYTYIACLFLKNNITPQKVNNFLQSTINVSLCQKTIKKHLHKLHVLEYVWKSKKWGYQLKSQKSATYINTKDIEWDFQKISNFYDSRFDISDSTFENYLKSKYKTFKLFIFSELLTRIHYNEVITKDRIRTEFGLNSNEVRELSNAFVGEYNFEHVKYPDKHIVRESLNDDFTEGYNDRKYTITSEWVDENDYLKKKRVKVTIGNVYTKDHFSIKASVCEWIKEKLNKNFDDNNYINKETKQKISHQDKVRVVDEKDGIFLLAGQQKPSGIKNHTSIDALTSGYETRNSKELYPKLAQNSYLVRCAIITRMLRLRKDRLLEENNSKHMLNVFSDLIYRNSKYAKTYLLENDKYVNNWRS